MTQLIKLAKVTSIPVTLDANTMYLLKDSSNKLSISLTDATGASALGLGINYADISGTPTLATVAVSGSYADLTNKPTLSTVAGTGSYADLLNKPTLSTLAGSGSFSDLLNVPTTAVALGLTDVVLTSTKGVANGVVDLDANAKIPLTRIPDSVLGQLEYQGPYDMTTALPTASNSNKGWYYIASNVTAANGYVMGDWAVSNGTTWDKIDNTDAVQSVAGRTGAITLTTADLTDFATAVTTPLGLKAPLASPTFTGTVTIPTATAGDNTTKAASTAFVSTAIGALTKTSVGLGNVDNTSDANKPVSTAQQTALDLKANSADVTTALALKAPLSITISTNTTLAASDNGKRVRVTGNVTVPTTAFADGNSVIIYNDSAASITITMTGFTAYLDGVNTSKTSYTLATRGTCAIMFNSATSAVLIGKSVS